jgi:hypothetical protein
MYVRLMLPDQAGCAFYRMIYPGLSVAEVTPADWTVEFCETWKGVTYVTDGPLEGMPVGVNKADIEGLDAVVLQRPLRKFNVEMIDILQTNGVAVIVDVDDDFKHVDRRHMAWRRCQPKYSPQANWAWLEYACSVADMVTVTTPALAERYGSHGRVAVLPNKVPKPMLGTVPGEDRDGRTVGWGGFVGTHPGDLQVTQGQVGLACQDVDARFMCVGSGEMVKKNLQLPDDVEYEVTGAQDFGDYPFKIAELDVGIVPLASTRFNEAKSALKGLEYAAIGVPFVASPTSDYLRVQEDGLGLIASTRKEWRRTVKQLLTDDELRLEMSKAGQEVVREKHLFEDHGWRWAEAWEQAVTNRQRDGKSVIEVASRVPS